jgi:hypothetical protein
LSQENVRGSLGVLMDLLNWLRIYRQRAFWIQIAANLVGILLWIFILPDESLGGAVAALPTLFLICFIITNVIWAASKRPYSCIIGSSIGYAIYNLAVIAILRLALSALDAVIYVLLGLVYGFVFSWFAFFIFTVLGLIKFERKKQGKDGLPSSITSE